MAVYLIAVGFGVLLFKVVYEYGWPPIAMFNSILRTERSRRVATVVGWVLTVGLLIAVGYRLWNNLRDLYAGI